MPLVIAVAAGGAAGSVLRWWIGTLAPAGGAAFPWSTLAINVAGSLLLGMLLGATLLADAPATRLALTVGFCGGFTTFSTFSVETVRLLQVGSYGRAGAYVTASVVLSLAAAAGGLAAARALPGAR